MSYDSASIYNTTAGASNYLGVIKNGNTSAIHDLNPSPVASGSGIFSSNESMPIAVAETPHSAASNMDQSLPAIIASGGRILKVRVSDQCDKDFVEIDLPVSKLSIQVNCFILSTVSKGFKLNFKFFDLGWKSRSIL